MKPWRRVVADPMMSDSAKPIVFERHPMNEPGVREMEPDEAQFIRETTCKVRWPHRWDDRLARMRPTCLWADWLAECGRNVDVWMRHGRTLVFGRPGVALGFLVAYGGVLRMLYVKREFRGAGIGLALAKAWAPIGPAHGAITVYRPTPSFLAWARHNVIDWRHDGVVSRDGERAMSKAQGGDTSR